MNLFRSMRLTLSRQIRLKPGPPRPASAKGSASDGFDPRAIGQPDEARCIRRLRYTHRIAHELHFTNSQLRKRVAMRSTLTAALLLCVFVATSSNGVAAENPCAAQYRLSSALLATLVRYNAATIEADRQTLWRTVAHQYGSLMDAGLSGPDATSCDFATTTRFDMAYGVRDVLGMANGSQPVTGEELLQALTDLAVAAVSPFGEHEPPADYLHGSHDIDSYREIPGFDDGFFQSTVLRLLNLYRTNHLDLDLSTADGKAVITPVLQYWAPGFENP